MGRSLSTLADSVQRYLRPVCAGAHTSGLSIRKSEEKDRKTLLTLDCIAFGTVFLNGVKWKPSRKYLLDQRGNAAIIIEYSNVCPFRWSRGMFICGYCAETFGDFDDLRVHTESHPNKIETMRFVKDQQVKVEVSNMRCEICLQSINDLDTFKEHLSSVHNKVFREEHPLGVAPFRLANQKFGCALCDTFFEKFFKLNCHMNEHFPHNVCFQCGKSFAAASRLKSHLATHEINQQFKCHKCPETFTTRIKKNYHVAKVHGSELRYKCPICKINLKSYEIRIKHMDEAHNRKVEYPCHLCPAVFPMYNRRNKHIKMVHTKNKQHSCELCLYQCVTAAQLRNHMVRHEGERNFECTICKKCFPRAKALKEHSRIHNNDRRFSCEYCTYSCIQKCSLKSHLKTHHQRLVEDA